MTKSLEEIWPGWQIEQQLGRGSYGVVYKASKKEHGVESHAAVKVISIPTDSSELESLRAEGMDESATRTYLQEIVNDFVSEIKMMEALKGIQNIVSVEDYRVIEREDAPGWDIYIRMELLTPFNTHICDKKLTEEEVIKLGCDICSALEICRKRNIIHRDIKPENIFINDFGFYKLGDFGIARKLESMTGGLSQKGTFSYMAPEVAFGRDYDARADIYSLGIVLYRLMNENRLPFLDTEKQRMNPNERKNAVERRLGGEKLPDPSEASVEMADVIMRACEYQPQNRFATAGEMRQALLNIGSGANERTATLNDVIAEPVSSAGLILDSTGDNTELLGENTVTTKSGSAAVTDIRTPVDGERVGSGSVKSGEHFSTDAPKKKSMLPKILIVALLISIAVGGVGFGMYRHKTAEQERIAAANAELEKAEKFEELMNEGTKLCETNPEEALALFKEAQEMFPEETAPFTSYAYALYSMASYEDCITYIEDELKMGKAYDIETQSKLSEMLGAAYFECADYAAAASFFRLSTAGGDITVDAQRDYAVSLGRLGDVEMADEILEEMYKNGVDNDITDYIQAEVDYAKKEYVTAEQAFLRLLETTDNEVLQKRSLRSLAEIYRDCAALVRVGKSPISVPATKAVEILSYGIETYGLRYDTTLWEMLALAYFEAYHTDETVPEDYLRKAGECFNRVIELGITKDYLFSNLYTIYYEMQEYELAEKTLAEYERVFPDRYEPHAFRAMMLITIENKKERDQRNYYEALEQFEAAGGKLKSSDDKTYYQQLESLILQLKQEGWIA